MLPCGVSGALSRYSRCPAEGDSMYIQVHLKKVKIQRERERERERESLVSAKL
jgi:hypothetical protein